MICLFTQFQLDAVELRSHVVARKPRDRGDLLVRKLVEPQHHDRLFERIEPVYQCIQIPQPLAAFGIFVGCAQRVGQRQPARMAAVAAIVRNAGVQRDAIDPRRNFGPAFESVESPPQVNQHLLIEIVEVVAVHGIEITDFADDAAVFPDEGLEFILFGSL